jgi:two-component system cell cycle response regulator DivK
MTEQKVLVCDDDIDILEITKLILQGKGYNVKTFTNCENIIERVLEFNPGVILLDLRIPPYGGEKVTGMLKENEQTSGIPLLIFSANAEIEQIAKSAGADGYLTKPFEIEALEKTVKDYIK